MNEDHKPGRARAYILGATLLTPLAALSTYMVYKGVTASTPQHITTQEALDNDSVYEAPAQETPEVHTPDVPKPKLSTQHKNLCLNDIVLNGGHNKYAKIRKQSGEINITMTSSDGYGIVMYVSPSESAPQDDPWKGSTFVGFDASPMWVSDHKIKKGRTTHNYPYNNWVGQNDLDAKDAFIALYDLIIDEFVDEKCDYIPADAVSNPEEITEAFNTLRVHLDAKVVHPNKRRYSSKKKKKRKRK